MLEACCVESELHEWICVLCWSASGKLNKTRHLKEIIIEGERKKMSWLTMWTMTLLDRATILHGISCVREDIDVFEMVE